MVRTKTITSLILVLLLSFICVLTVRPQSNDNAKKTRVSSFAERRQSKHEAIKDEDRSESSGEGEEWFARGYAFHNSDQYQEAIKAFMYAMALDYRSATAMYNIACGYSLMNDKENALIWLQRSLESGFGRRELVASDSDLDPLRTDPRFQNILAGIPNNNDNDKDQSGFLKVKGEVRPDRLADTNLNYGRLENEGSRDGREWAKVGLDLLRLRELDRAAVALTRAINYLDYKGSSAMYNLACAYALQGNRAVGIEWLEKAVNAGFDSPEKLRNDPDINNLRSDPRFPVIDKLSNTLTLSQFKDKRNNSRHSDDFNYSKERWAPAIALYESFLKSDPTN